MRRDKGFTMVELLVVLAVVALLLSLVAPRYLQQTDRAREAVLRENLAALRLALDQYYGDRGHYPEQLEELVQARYLRALPRDPVTNQPTSWQPVTREEGGRQVIVDVRSGAAGAGMDGTAYSTW